MILRGIRFLGQDREVEPLFHFCKRISRDILAEDVKTCRVAYYPGLNHRREC